MKRQTQIVCTLGPASRTAPVILKLAREGMNIARINFSHGTLEEHLELMETIRAVNRKHGTAVEVLQDLEGYRMRIGRLRREKVLKEGQELTFSYGLAQKGTDIPLDADFDMRALKAGMDIFVDDGMITLRVVSRTTHQARVEVVRGGLLKSRKGVNIPDLRLHDNILTEKDRNDLAAGLEAGVDYVAQSFVRNRADIQRVAEIARERRPDCRLVAKIENQEGVAHVESIADACDGVIVARGDLGVSLPIYQIPLVQKDIIRRCRQSGKCVMVATQMLESMTVYPRPTRAEVTDVANAILDGAHCVMLSGETAVGQFPVETVRMMRQIIEYTEAHAPAREGVR